MKKRTGFVSNSSSASFIIDKDCLSKRQIDKIHNHIEEAKRMSDPKNTPDGYEFQYGWDDAWTINERKGYISGDTTMTNFSMDEFLIDIGIDESDIKWESD